MIKRLDLNDSPTIARAFPIIRQLRKHLSLQDYQGLVSHLQCQSYELWAYEAEGQIQGLIGMREYADLVRGFHLYIDDLVVDEGCRSRQIGAKLLKFAEEESRRRGLPSLRLACALDNAGGIKFYEREGWAKRSYSYVKKLA